MDENNVVFILLVGSDLIEEGYEFSSCISFFLYDVRARNECIYVL